MKYKVLGYTEDNEVLFLYKDKHIYLKASLPKADLCFKLDVDAMEVCKNLKNAILNKAKEGGKWGWRWKDKDGNLKDIQPFWRDDKGKYVYNPGFWVKLEH